VKIKKIVPGDGYRLSGMDVQPGYTIFFIHKSFTMTGDMIIAAIAVAGGLAIGAISIIVSIPWAIKEKMARLEARTKERLALIEKGINPAEFLKEPKRAGNDPLFWGLLLAGLGLGIFLGYLLSLVIGWDSTVLSNSLAILFGGVGLIIYRLVAGKPNDQPPA
jgi:hypothetical protein